MSAVNRASGRAPVGRDLHPASFAMVMATGIVSTAAELRGYSAAARAMLWINVGLYVALWALTLWRLLRYRPQVAADVLDHGRCVGYFTIVAGTCVLGSQFVVVEPQPIVARALWLLGIGLWALVTYGLFTVLTVKSHKPTLAEGINGAWLVAVVAAQSVASLGGLLAPGLGETREAALFFSLIMWLGGGMLYIWIIALIFYRYAFFNLDPQQLAPPYWVNMGAMAISTLAGTILADNQAGWSLLEQLKPFVIGLTLLFWATATWWIPLLVALGVWRHAVRRVPLTYDVVYWSLVFPLGMYTAATHRLARVIDQPLLDVVPRYFLWIAAAAWVVTFAGWLHRQWRWALGA